MQRRLYIFWLFYNCGCRDNEIFSFRANFGFRPIPEFGGNSLVFLMENDRLTGSCINVCDVDTSRRPENNVTNTYTFHVSFESTHSIITPILPFLVSQLIARSVQLGWSSIQSAFLLSGLPWTLVLIVYILLFPILSVVIAVLGSCITWIHVREDKRTWGRFHPLRDI